MKNFLAFLGIPVLIFLIIIPVGLFNSWAIGVMYEWFVRPLGAPALNIWHVWGLVLLFGLLTNRTINTDDDNKPVKNKLRDSVVRFVATIIATLLTLLIGLIIHAAI